MTSDIPEAGESKGELRGLVLAWRPGARERVGGWQRASGQRARDMMPGCVRDVSDRYYTAHRINNTFGSDQEPRTTLLRQHMEQYGVLRHTHGAIRSTEAHTCVAPVDVSSNKSERLSTHAHRLLCALF